MTPRSCSILVAVAGCSPAASAPAPLEVPIELGAPPASAPPDAAPAPVATENEGYEIYPGVAVDEKWVGCRSEEECVIVEAGCCDHCNGGAITAVARPYGPRAHELLENTACDARCGSVSCDAPDAHQLICMTRACHIDDLEPEVQERIWGASAAPDDDAPSIIEDRP